MRPLMFTGLGVVRIVSILFFFDRVFWCWEISIIRTLGFHKCSFSFETLCPRFTASSFLTGGGFQSLQISGVVEQIKRWSTRWTIVLPPGNATSLRSFWRTRLKIEGLFTKSRWIVSVLSSFVGEREQVATVWVEWDWGKKCQTYSSMKEKGRRFRWHTWQYYWWVRKPMETRSPPFY